MSSTTAAVAAAAAIGNRAANVPVMVLAACIAVPLYIAVLECQIARRKRGLRASAVQAIDAWRGQCCSVAFVARCLGVGVFASVMMHGVQTKSNGLLWSLLAAVLFVVGLATAWDAKQLVSKQPSFWQACVASLHTHSLTHAPIRHTARSTARRRGGSGESSRYHSASWDTRHTTCKARGCCVF